MGLFDGKVLLVTGAAHGQGRATALAFAREGAAGTSAPKVLEQTCTTVAGQASCGKIVQAMGIHTVATLTADASGVANTPDLTTGKTYYLFGSAVSSGRKVTWHLPLKATAGWTRVVLSTANQVP